MKLAKVVAVNKLFITICWFFIIASISLILAHNNKFISVLLIVKTLSTINKVIGVSPTSLTVVGVNTVTGDVDGGIPTSQEDVSNLQLVGSQIQKTLGSGNETDNESLYSAFPKDNVQ